MSLHDKEPDNQLPSLPRPKRLPLIGDPSAIVPMVVPARMINEVLYCERLMYLEWVQGEFADNVFTVDGRVTHARADEPGGRMPPTAASKVADEKKASAEGEADDRPYQARSVWLTSERLGMTAKIDIVEGDASGTVLPIEYKRGHAPDLTEGAYLPERAQLCAQVLLLREHGYTCNEGSIYFAKSKRRVPIAITEGLVVATLQAVKVAREVAARVEPPPPLNDHPKCNGCSLVSICLPDEVNLLQRLRGETVVEPPEPYDQLTQPLTADPWGLVGETAETPANTNLPAIRRLHAALDDRVPLYVQDARAQIGLSGERISIRSTEGTKHVRLMNTSQVVVQGNAQVTTQVIRELFDRDIPLVYLSGGGWFVGRATGTETNNVDLRIAQHQMSGDSEVCLRLARGIVVSKIRNCRTMLRRNLVDPSEVTLSQLKQLGRKAASCEQLESLLGIEGSAAREYFQAFSGMLKHREPMSFDLERRNRRPPRDPVNALLSFAYALLTKELVITTTAVGLDPLLGFYHQPRFGRPALALDLMEEFRPLIADSVVVAVINNQVVSSDDFVFVADACNLKPEARRKVIDAFERRMDHLVTHPVFGYRISYRRVLEVQARLLTRVLLGELDELPAFSTR